MPVCFGRPGGKQSKEGEGPMTAKVTDPRRRCRGRGRNPQLPGPWGARFALTIAWLALLGATAGTAAAATLPDNRGYEQVTPLDKNGVDVGTGIPSPDGNKLDWESIGGCCGANTSSGAELFQETRGASGWSVKALTPKPPHPQVSLFAEQAPMWWSPDLGNTVFWTAAGYDPKNTRPGAPGVIPYADVYLEDPNGGLSWISQGPFAGAGTAPLDATFDGATPDATHLVFSTGEQMTADATGLADRGTPPEFLYLRNTSDNTTQLVDVTTTALSAAAASGDSTITVASSSAFASGQPITIGSESDTVDSVPDGTHIALSSPLTGAHPAGTAVEALISPDGAILGNGNWLDSKWQPANLFGTTTNAISSDGNKVFFESPPTFAGGSGSAEGVGPAHLYMREFSNDSTTPLDNPSAASPGGARYEGASQDGSRVFFTSNEGLGSQTNTDNELYMFNTTGQAIGNAGPMSVLPISGGADGTADGDVLGVTAISNDGSEVWFVAHGVLASNTSQGQTATDGQPNLYVYDTNSNTTKFIATLVLGDVTSCIPSCSSSPPSTLVGEPDMARPAIPTPDGSALVFDSSSNLTGQNTGGPGTTVTEDSFSGETSLTVASTDGMVAGREIIVGAGFNQDAERITQVVDSTHLNVSPVMVFGHSPGENVTQQPAFEIYKYMTSDGSLTCISCTPAGQAPTGDATLGGSAGGTYDPPGQTSPMSADASKIFFNTPDPLVPADGNTGHFPVGGLFGGFSVGEDVYEWEGGKNSLISDGTSTTGSFLGGTTPTGNDVFFTTRTQLVPRDTDGYFDIYDARVGGGFPPSTGPGTANCLSPDTCRTGVSPTQFFPIPGSATLIAPTGLGPSFSVGSLSKKQRKQWAKSGKVQLKVSATAAGTVAARVFAKIRGNKTQVASASHTFSGASGGTTKLKLKLVKAARNALGKKHKLGLTIEVTYSQSTETDMATLTLKKKGA